MTIARRELASLRSEKTIVLALTIQLFVAAFSSFLVVGLVSLYDPGSVEGYTADIGVVGNASDDVDAVLREQEGADPTRFADRAAAGDAFEGGEIDAVIVAERTPEGVVETEVTVPRESIRTTVLVIQLRDALETLERTLRDRYADRLANDPLALPDEARSSPYFGFSYTVLVPLLMFLPVFISGSVAVDTLTEEIQRGTLELLRVAPVSLTEIVDAKLVAAATLAPVQAGLWLLLLSLNGTAIAHPFALIGVVGAFSLAVVAVGLGIALLAPDRRQAQFIYSSGILLIVAATLLLPEHPVNTVAKLAIGSATTTTWIAVAGYGVIGVVAYVVVNRIVARLGYEGV
ncbi:sodium ABC transporter permease [Halobacteriales archaeon SW_7_68_16]|nr:MAG: sodium ABC transporter permease [Halobacteriales archaeon SW_7_68_16]